MTYVELRGEVGYLAFELPPLYGLQYGMSYCSCKIQRIQDISTVLLKIFPASAPAKSISFIRPTSDAVAVCVFSELGPLWAAAVNAQDASVASTALAMDSSFLTYDVDLVTERRHGDQVENRGRTDPSQRSHRDGRHGPRPYLSF